MFGAVGLLIDIDGGVIVLFDEAISSRLTYLAICHNRHFLLQLQLSNLIYLLVITDFLFNEVLSFLTFLDLAVDLLPLSFDFDDFPVANVTKNLDLTFDNLLVLLLELLCDVRLDLVDDLLLSSFIFNFLLLEVQFKLFLRFGLSHGSLYDLHLHHLFSSDCFKSFGFLLLSQQFRLLCCFLLFSDKFQHVSLLLADNALLQRLE